MPSATSDVVPHLQRKLGYQIRLQEKAAVSSDVSGETELPREVIEETDLLILEALNKLYDPKDVHRVENARKMLIQAHTNLYVAARRERVTRDA